MTELHAMSKSSICFEHVCTFLEKYNQQIFLKDLLISKFLETIILTENIPKFSVFVLNIIKAVKYIAVFNIQSIMFYNIFCL